MRWASGPVSFGRPRPQGVRLQTQLMLVLAGRLGYTCCRFRTGGTSPAVVHFASLQTPMTIKRVSPVSVGKVAGLLYALVGLLVGAMFSLIAFAGGMAAGAAGEEAGHGAMFGALFGVGAIVIFPILYGVMGFISAMIMALIYNLVAGIVGGIEIDVA